MDLPTKISVSDSSKEGFQRFSPDPFVSTRRAFLSKAGGLAACAGLPMACGKAPAPIADGPFQATAKSLRTHNTPTWFKDAKFGIFIHWGPYSIPAFASDLRETQGEEGFDYNPYAEWYQNTMQFEGSPTAIFHRDTYGADYPYERFGTAFNESLNNWDPDEWARLFKRSGARYVVIVAKHHDGFVLWPSSIPNPNRQNWGTQRDVVGELAEAVRGQGLRFGIYYSGGVDWTFQPKVIDSMSDFIFQMPGRRQGYTEYADAQYRELIDRYKPDYLWNDIGYPDQQSCFNILAHYYNSVPEGLTNDRWINLRGLLRPGAFRKPEGVPDAFFLPEPPVWDIRTPEYMTFHQLIDADWETTRGMGLSFGYNRMETEDDLLSVGEIAQTIAQATAYNGNVLLNVGPRGDATIDPPQAERLEGIGRWLESHGNAIYNTRPVELPEQSIRAGAVRNETNGFLLLLEKPASGAVTVKVPEELMRYTRAEALGQQGVEAQFVGGSVTIETASDWPDEPVVVTLT